MFIFSPFWRIEVRDRRASRAGVMWSFSCWPAEGCFPAVSFPCAQAFLGYLPPLMKVTQNWCFWMVVLMKTLESPLDSKIKPVHPTGNQLWIFIGRAEAEAPILWPPYTKSRLWKRPWCWERWKAGGEGDDRRQYGWMASPTQWTWVWTSSGRWWRTGRSGVLQSMGLQRVRHDWVTEQ